MNRTPNHGYNTPADGATNWGAALNKNFEAIDRSVEVRDVESNRDDYEPHEGAKYEATDSGAVYRGTGDEWKLVDREIGSLRSKHFNGAVFTTGYDGDSEADRFQAAVNDINAGTVVIPGPEHGAGDSRKVEWDRDITVDPTEYDDGISIVIEAGVRIQYTGSGVPLTFDSKGDVNSQLEGCRLRFRNEGRWDGSRADNPEGGLLFLDINHADIDVGTVRGWQNHRDDAYGVKFSNRLRWSENNSITGYAKHVNRGIVFDGYNTTSSRGTTSLQDTYVHDFTADIVSNRGFEFSGDMSGSAIVKPTSMCYENGCAGYYINGATRGVTFLSPECEEFGASGVMWEFGPRNTGKTPLVVGADVERVSRLVRGNGQVANVEGGAGDAAVRVNVINGPLLEMRGNGELDYSNDGRRIMRLEGDGDLRIAGSLSEHSNI